MNRRTNTHRPSVTLPQALVFAFAMGACSWAFNTLQTALATTVSVSDLQQRISALEHDYRRGCSHDAR